VSPAFQSRRQFLRLAGAAAILPAMAQRARAQSYPARPLRWVVGFPPGGGADIVSRIMAPWLSERLGQPVVIENKPGASSNISIQAVVNSPPDGYTLLFVPASAAVNVTLFDQLPFNLLRDITPVSGLIDFPLVMVANPSFPAKTVAELVAHAKANPGKISMASFGTGSTSHVTGELFKMMTGVNMIHVPYRGGAPMVADLVSGQVQVGIDVLTGSLAHIRAGTLRIIAVAGKNRSEALPDVPTIGETVAGYEANSWCGLGVPRGTPGEIVEPRDQCRAGRSGGASTARPSGDHADRVHPCRVRHLHGGRGREVGQGGQALGHPAGIIQGAVA
jgi:tripartite-type tricarboxylate transporter receptor subunit TctC